MSTTPLNIRLPTPDPKVYTNPAMSRDQREFRRQIELAFMQLAQQGAVGSDGSYAAEAFLWNEGDVLEAGDSDWLFIPWDFSIESAEMVSDQDGSLVVAVYASTYVEWPTFTLISASAPLTITGAAPKSHPALTGWTTAFTGGTYLRFTTTSAALLTKATITLRLSIPNTAPGRTGSGQPTGAAGGVLSGEYPDPGFAEDMATLDEVDEFYLDAIDRANHTGSQTASTISDFDSAARAQVESEMVAGTGMTITPSGSGATRQLTIASTGGASLTSRYSYWDPFVPDASPHADTDEFTSSSTISNWTGIYTGDASVVNDIATTQGRGMYFEAPSVQYRIRSRMKAILVGDFTVHAAVMLNAHAVGGGVIISAGIVLADGTTPAAGKQTGVVVARSTAFGAGALSTGRLAWANYGNDATSAAYDTFDWAHSITFLRLRRVSTTYSRAVSADGENWTESNFTLLAGLTPTHCGLGFQNYGAVGVASATVLFYRVYATGTQYKTGALLNRYA